MADVVVTTAVDAHVRQDRANENYKGNAGLHLRSDAGSQRQAFIHFSRPFPLGVTIVRAELKVYLRGGGWSGGPHTITARRVTSKWKEGAVTWANRPSVTATNLATVAVSGGSGGSGGDEVVIDLAAMLQDVAAGGEWFGVRLEVDTTGTKKVHSSESAAEALQPVLEVEWAEAPDPPLDLRPSGGLVVSGLRPLLLWTFEDPTGDLSQSAAHVQVDEAGGDFAVPVWDSGEVATTDTQMTVGTDLTDGADYDWRVRARDANGLWSDWSDEASFGVRAKGSVAITSPGATVDTTTPLVEHAVTGATQTAVQRQVFEEKVPNSGQWVLVYDTNQVAGVDTAWQVPAGVLTQEDRDYKVRVQVWDEQDREEMPGDRAFIEDEQVFRLVRSSVPPPVTWVRASTG